MRVCVDVGNMRRGATLKRYEGRKVLTDTGCASFAVVADYTVVVAHRSGALACAAVLVEPVGACERGTAFPAICEASATIARQPVVQPTKLGQFASISDVCTPTKSSGSERAKGKGRGAVRPSGHALLGTHSCPGCMRSGPRTRKDRRSWPGSGWRRGRWHRGTGCSTRRARRRGSCRTGRRTGCSPRWRTGSRS